MSIKRLSDGILFQFLMVGSLSFSHIHDVVSAHGQAGWKSWLYPLSVDLLTVAAYRKILAAHRVEGSAGLAWFSFLLGLAASLAANVVDSWTAAPAAPAGRVLAVAIGVWPAIALLVCTLLGHDQAAPAQPTTEPTAPAPVPVPVPVKPAPTPVPAPVMPEQITPPSPVPASAPDLPPIAPPLLAWARGIADQHRQTTGSPITPDALATRLRIAPALAEAVHGHLNAQPAGV